ncbi:MAG: hypothetical protein K9H48_14940 [Melioribacteraceae bacterium]|nr:hypothetical protein [Saprospiraceae bacterium]MCF8355746.1 hypothetical protein [Melioribacteraceae bacterium]MCF8394774.1 hypothetical protein [Melioribacteraceae bacterium]
MKIGYLITARLKSTRLPEKLLLKVQDGEFIRWMIRRLKITIALDEIILCTSTNPQDSPLEIIAEEEGIKCFRGDEEDVLFRLNDAIIKYNLDYALNITADCPLVSYEYIPLIINEYKRTNADLIRTLDLPHGLFSYGIKPEALNYICKNKTGKNTEVWAKYFTDDPKLNVNEMNIPAYLMRPDYRLTLDYPEDYEVFKRIFEFFGKESYKIGIADLLYFLDNNKSIVDINQNCRGLYKQRWDSQNKIDL